MPLASCPRCGKMFTKTPDRLICEGCLPEETADQERVVSYVAETPEADPASVAEATGVDVEVVLRMVDTGRIKLVTGDQKVVCGRCGMPAISLSKRLCRGCLAQLNARFAEEASNARLPRKKFIMHMNQKTVVEAVRNKLRS